MGIGNLPKPRPVRSNAESVPSRLESRRMIIKQNVFSSFGVLQASRRPHGLSKWGGSRDDQPFWPIKRRKRRAGFVTRKARRKSLCGHQSRGSTSVVSIRASIPL